MAVGALGGLRVLDLCGDSGRLAGKLLAEAGADVVRLRTGSSGTALPAAVGARGGALDWWFEAGTRHAPLDLDDAADRESFRALVAHCDLLLESEPPGRLKALRLDYPQLAVLNPALVHVSLTPFGRQGPRAGWQSSDLVANALGGALSVTGDPDLPINPWGRQAYTTGSFYAAVCGLAALLLTRTTGRGQHIDLSLHEAVISCTEQVLMGWFYQDRLPGVQREQPFGIYRRQRSLHWSGAYEVVPCANGHVMTTLVPGTAALLGWLAENGENGAVTDVLAGTSLPTERIPELMSTLHRFAATRDAHQLFLDGQQRHLAWGEVLSVAQAAAGPQLQARGFFRPVAWDGPSVRTPGPLFRMSGTPAPDAAPPPAAPTPAAVVATDWARPARAESAASEQGLPLAGLRVLDFSWVLAGPFATRLLADLGAEVIKVQTDTRAQGSNSSESPYFAMWSRNKQSIALNMKHADAPETFRRLVEQSDVILENFSAGVLDRWGVGYETLRSWNPRIIYVAMSGVGRDGPWRDFVTYAPTVHALAGLTHLTGLPGEADIGFGHSFNDHASGLAGALAVLEALHARERTGTGQFIDLAQLEVGAYLIGPAYVAYLNGGGEPQPAGNRDAFADFVPNEVYLCQDGGWLALTARDDGDWQRLLAVLNDDTLSAAALATISGRRAQRTLIVERLRAWAAGQQADAAMRMLQSAGVPAGKVQDARDLTGNDEQLAARGWLGAYDHPTLGHRPVDVFPARFSGATLPQARPAPLFGEDTFAVFRDLLGWSEERIAAAMADGLLG